MNSIFSSAILERERIIKKTMDLICEDNYTASFNISFLLSFYFPVWVEELSPLSLVPLFSLQQTNPPPPPQTIHHQFLTYTV